MDVLIRDQGGAPLARVREAGGIVGALLRPLRATPLGEALPLAFRVETPEGRPIAELRRGIALLRPSVEVLGPDGASLGRLRYRLWAKAGPFDVLARDGRKVATLRGTSFVDPRGRELAELPERAAGPTVVFASDLDEKKRVLLLAAAAAVHRLEKA